MATQSTAARQNNSLINLPSNPIGYLVILAAVITGVIHLLLGPQVMGFSQLLGVLFILNGIGFLGGTIIYLTNYWRSELYLVAAGYAIATIFGLFMFQGFSIEAFYMNGDLNPMAVVSKAAEAVIALGTLYIHSNTSA